jgi:hypothetical protein
LKETVKLLAVDESRISAFTFDIRDDLKIYKLVESIPEKDGSLDYAL